MLCCACPFISSIGLPPCFEIVHALIAVVCSGVDYLAPVVGDRLFSNCPHGIEVAGRCGGLLFRAVDRGKVFAPVIARLQTVVFCQRTERSVCRAIVGEHQCVVAVCVLQLEDLFIDKGINGIALNPEAAACCKHRDRQSHNDERTGCQIETM